MNILIVLIFSTFWAHFAIAAKRQINNEEINGDFIVGTLSTNLQCQREDLPSLECEFAPDLIVGSRARELECCNELLNLYYLQWATNSMSLTAFLETLRQWNCPQYEEQCVKRVFAFTTFNKLVYDYFCNYTTAIETCLSQVNTTVSSMLQRYNSSLTKSSKYTAANLKNFPQLENSTNSSEIMKWKNLASLIRPSMLSIDELKEPCVAIAQYDNEKVHNGGYQELINFLVPTCELTWCGFSAEAFRDHEISFWTCLTSR